MRGQQLENNIPKYNTTRRHMPPYSKLQPIYYGLILVQNTWTKYFPSTLAIARSEYFKRGYFTMQRSYNKKLVNQWDIFIDTPIIWFIKMLDNRCHVSMLRNRVTTREHWLFIQQVDQANITANVNDPHYPSGPLWWESTGPCLTKAIWRCRKNSSQWQRSFQWKQHSHWLKFLRQRHVAVVRQGPGKRWIPFTKG